VFVLRKGSKENLRQLADREPYSIGGKRDDVP